jgi:L-threonylcarbamoyladenylate synthase
MFIYELSAQPAVKVNPQPEAMRLPMASAPILPATDATLSRAAAVLRAGGLVAFPTETVYGLGADATLGTAVAGIYAAKGRPSFNPLIAHVPDLAHAEQEGRFDRRARTLAEAFWPGPLTLVVPVSDTTQVCELARAGLPSVGLRVPAHPVARALLAAVGRPVAAPSANRSGHVSPTLAAHVAADLADRIDLIVDGGACPVGVESTIIACLGGPAELLRPGGVSRRMAEEALGEALAEAAPDGGNRPIAPGLLASHYAPRARVRLAATSAAPDEAVLDFGGQLAGQSAAARLDLSPRGDLIEAAANLFGHLRRLDATGVAGIAVAPIPDGDLGEAINDRLRRAAADR